MEHVRLGSLEVSELGFGCMNLATNYGPAVPIDEPSKSSARPKQRRDILRYGGSLRTIYQ